MENQIETREVSINFSEPMTIEITRLEIELIKANLKKKHPRSQKTGGEILRGLVRKGYQFEGFATVKIVPSGSNLSVELNAVFGDIGFRLSRFFELPTHSLLPCGNKRVEWVDSVYVKTFNELGDYLSMMSVDKFTESGGVKAVVIVNGYDTIKLKANLHPRS